MSTVTTTQPGAIAAGSPLRQLYVARTVFAVAWAGVFATTGSTLGTLAAALLVLYPAVDAIAALIDARSTTDDRSRVLAGVNLGLSTVAAVGLGIAASADVADVLRVWGAWAIVSGLVQLIGAARRRHLGGQRFLIASGGLSVLAGTSFALSAADATSMAGLAGYAVLGGIFFLVSALRLGRTGAPRAAEDAVTERGA